MSLFYAHVYVLYELFFIDNDARLLSCVNTCSCHVYFTINLLTYFSGLSRSSSKAKVR